MTCPRPHSTESRRRAPTALPWVALALLAACGGGADTPAQRASDLGIRNVAEPVPGLITAAQPDRQQLEALVGLGYGRVISLQLSEEPGAGWEEARVPAVGGQFVRIPVAGPDDLTRENVEALAAALEGAEGEDAVLYCASSNRVGALLALKAFWFDGVPEEEALSLGRRAGMRALEPAVRSLMAEDQ